MEHRLLCLADYEPVSGDDCAGPVAPFRAVRALAAHVAAAAASPASLVRLVWPPCVAGHAISLIRPAVEKLTKQTKRKYNN